MIPTLETERLILRSFRNDDHEPVAAFYEHDSGAHYVGGPMTSHDAWRRIAAFIGHWHLRGFGPFALEEKATRRWVGWCALWRPPEFPEIELGWTLREAARGRGFVDEAARRVRVYAYETLRLGPLVSFIVADNTPSQRVAERLGARLEGDVMIRGTTVGAWRHPGREARS
jgi:RimJ/RimL family protein N-acetyltransferase